MNLHISAPSVFIDAFHKNLVKLDLEKNNKIILRTSKPHDFLPGAKLYSDEFNTLVGDTGQYDKVFIHQFNPLLYRWVAQHDFKELNWMIWGADLYNLPALEKNFYEPLTRNWIRTSWDLSEFLYKTKVFFTASRYKKRAYQKVDNVLTWMKSEYDFAKKSLDLKASHKFFFYENQTPYHELKPEPSSDQLDQSKPTYVVGNSAAKTNNHLDVLKFLSDHSIKANLIIPVSYGDKRYVAHLKKEAAKFKNLQITFQDSFMKFNEYVSFLNSTDGLIMNTLRPQGYGNIFMMLSLDKPVYLNNRNVSLPDLDENGIQYTLIEELKNPDSKPVASAAGAIRKVFDSSRMDHIYRELFS